MAQREYRYPISQNALYDAYERTFPMIPRPNNHWWQALLRGFKATVKQQKVRYFLVVQITDSES